VRGTSHRLEDDRRDLASLQVLHRDVAVWGSALEEFSGRDRHRFDIAVGARLAAIVISNCAPLGVVVVMIYSSRFLCRLRAVPASAVPFAAARSSGSLSVRLLDLDRARRPIPGRSRL
jgi:hypothetical protein